MDKVKKIISWIVLIILLIFTIINGILLVKNRIYGIETPDINGYIPIIMNVDTMQPTINYYDLFIDKKITTEADLNVNDIVTYKYADKIITSRIAKIIVKDGRKNYIMLDDATQKYICEITFSNMKGKYLYTIPYIGPIIKYIRTPIGLIIAISIIVVPFLLIDIILRNKKLSKIKKLKSDVEKIVKEKEKLEIDKKKRQEGN